MGTGSQTSHATYSISSSRQVFRLNIQFNYIYLTTSFHHAGTKNDLRDVDDPNLQLVSLKDGKKLARQIRAECYLECSAQRLRGLDEIITEAVRASMKKRRKTTKQNPNCVLV